MDYAQRPGDHECFDYHRDYVAKVPDGNILETLTSQHESATQYIRELSDDVLEVIHEPYGWSIRTVIEHCCDAERVFGYRILRFAAGDDTDLPGWDQDIYASANYGDAKSAADLGDEFHSLRLANLCLLKRLDPNRFDHIGTADGREVSVRTLAWLMAGHWNHHLQILKKRLS